MREGSRENMALLMKSLIFPAGCQVKPTKALKHGWLHEHSSMKWIAKINYLQPSTFSLTASGSGLHFFLLFSAFLHSCLLLFLLNVHIQFFSSCKVRIFVRNVPHVLSCIVYIKTLVNEWFWEVFPLKAIFLLNLVQSSEGWSGLCIKKLEALCSV